MQTIEGLDFFHLSFDKDGALQSTAEFDAMKQHVNSAGATDAVFIAHGFRNDEQEAASLYTNFLKTFHEHRARPEFQAALGGRKIVVAGVFWPSKAFREAFPESAEAGGVQGLGDDAVEREQVRKQLVEMRDQDARPAARPKIDKAIALLPTLENNPDAQDEFVALVLSLLDGSALDATEGLEQVRAKSGSELLNKLGAPRQDAANAGFFAFGNVLGVGQ